MTKYPVPEQDSPTRIHPPLNWDTTTKKGSGLNLRVSYEEKVFFGFITFCMIAGGLISAFTGA